MKLSVFFIGVLALVFGGYAVGRAQSSDKDSIEFGTTMLRPGMSRDSVVAALAKYYNVNDDGSVISRAGPPHSKSRLAGTYSLSTRDSEHRFSSSGAEGNAYHGNAAFHETLI